MADKLVAGDPITPSSGEESVTLVPPQTVEFEGKAERETGGGTPELSVAFELEWDENGGTGDGSLEFS